MTPYEIELLLWYYARVEDHPDVKRRPPIFQPTIDDFSRKDLLEPAAREEMPEVTYKLTSRGRMYCEALQRVPLPEVAWIINWPTDGLVTGR